MQNGNDPKKVFYLDTFSSREIIPDKMEVGKNYRFYYDRLTKIIVGVDVVEDDDS